LPRGFSITNTSVCSGPIGSSLISARPVLLTTVSTSGKVSRRFSRNSATSTEPSSEAFGRRTTLMASEPSSSGGMNSVPSRGSSARLPARTTPAASSVQAAPPQRALQQPQVALVEAPHEGELALGRHAQQQVRQRRHHRQRHDQRDEQRDQHGHRQRREHAPFDALQREQRHQRDGDDEHRERHRARHLDHGAGHDLPWRLIGPGMRQVTAHVLHDHDRGVDDHAHREREAAQAHQVGVSPTWPITMNVIR
jgi:hypothetical protein